MSTSPPKDGLTALLQKLPAPHALIPLSLGISGLGLTMFLAPLGAVATLLAFPVMSAGALGLGLSYLKVKRHVTVSSSRRLEVAQSTEAHAEQLKALLAERPDGVTVLALSEETGLEKDDVVLALGALQGLGHIEEDVSNDNGAFTYRLSATGSDPDEDSHLSLEDRMRRAQKKS